MYLGRVSDLNFFVPHFCLLENERNSGYLVQGGESEVDDPLKRLAPFGTNTGLS